MRFAFMIVLVGVLVASCSGDNATSLVAEIGDGASRLHDGSPSITVSFDPAKGQSSPYTVIFFPDRDVTEAELVGAGVNKAIAHQIYTEMAYLGSFAGKLVVAQQGERLKFTSSWKQLAEVQPPQDVVVSRWKTGQLAIDLTRENGTIRVVAMR